MKTPLQQALHLLAQFLSAKENSPAAHDYRTAYYQLRGGHRHLFARIQSGEPLEVRELVNLAGAAIVLLRERIDLDARGLVVPNADRAARAAPVDKPPVSCSCIYADGVRVPLSSPLCPEHPEQ